MENQSIEIIPASGFTNHLDSRYSIINYNMYYYENHEILNLDYFNITYIGYILYSI